jgi:hypothetical protein
MPPRERQCESCGRKFKSRKTARKHKCPKSKVVRVSEKAGGGQASQAQPPPKQDKPAAPPAPPAPTAPSNNTLRPAVTGDLRGPHSSSRPPAAPSSTVTKMWKRLDGVFNSLLVGNEFVEQVASEGWSTIPPGPSEEVRAL